MGKIAEAIREEACKLVSRHQTYLFNLHEETRRLNERSGIIWQKELLVPEYWNCHDGFDPYHVRKHADSIGYSIERAIRRGIYRPRPGVQYRVPKDDGTERTVTVFPVADQAVSKLLFKCLLKKNRARFSSRSFAYRADLTVHDAVLHISSSLAGQNRIFLAEYDFRKYFDTISHGYLDQILDDKRFCFTAVERRIVRMFITSSIYDPAAYRLDHIQERQQGIPQGTSISLFLANLAAHPLDRRLEMLRVDFARYADDTLVWSSEYHEVCRAVDMLAEASREMGAEFNLKKSPGVRILIPEEASAELESTTYVEFVGYRVNAKCISIRDNTVKRIKQHIARLIYVNLLQQPKAGRLVANRVTGDYDTDYTIMVAQLRRYLYGDLTEIKLAKYLSGHTPNIAYRGLMSFYPLVDDEHQLRELDGWMLHTVYTTLCRRRRLFNDAGTIPTAIPHKIPNHHGLLDPALGRRRLPSFLRIAKFLNKAAQKYGASAVAAKPGPPS